MQNADTIGSCQRLMMDTSRCHHIVRFELASIRISKLGAVCRMRSFIVMTEAASLTVTRYLSLVHSLTHIPMRQALVKCIDPLERHIVVIATTVWKALIIIVRSMDSLIGFIEESYHRTHSLISSPSLLSCLGPWYEHASIVCLFQSSRLKDIPFERERERERVKPM